jgi:DNA-binding SARP family transcriptional activator
VSLAAVEEVTVAVRVLGSLQVENHAGTILPGGTRLRALLGYLLLHANSVVPHSDLVWALWGEHAPVSPLDAVRRSISRLRGVLAGSGVAIEVSTCPGGYMLEMEPEFLDLHRFRELAAQGRATLAGGDAEGAAETLKKAVALWRGPVLADVVDRCGWWREPKALDELRFDVLELYFAAELSIGRHHAVLGDLAAAVAEAPARERLATQLVLAHHRSGRVDDALAVCHTAWARLVELRGAGAGEALLRLAEAIANGCAESRVDAVHRLDLDVPAPVPALEERAPLLEVRSVTTLAIEVKTGTVGVREPAGDLVRALDLVIRAVLDRFGGVHLRRTGSVWTLSLGADRACGDETVRAVRAGLSVRHALSEFCRTTDDVVLRMAVCDGPVLVGHGSGAADFPAEPGPAEKMVPLVSSQELWLNSLAHDRVSDVIDCRRAATPADAWIVVGPASRRPSTRSVPFLGRSAQLADLMKELNSVTTTMSSRRVAVVGVMGSGRTRMLDEFAAQASGEGAVVLRAPRSSDDTALPALEESVRVLSGCLLRDTPGSPEAELFQAVRRVARREAEAEWMFSVLNPVVSGSPSGSHAIPELERAWSRFVLDVAAARPVVLLLDDVDSSDFAVWAMAERLLLAEESAALLVVTSEKPGSRHDREPRDAVVPLPPLAPDQIDALIDHLAERGGKPLPAERRAGVAQASGGNPMFAEEYVRALGSPECDAGTPHVIPEKIVRAVTASVDKLPISLRSTLHEVALAERTTSSASEAVVADAAAEEMVTRRLNRLVRLGFLSRARGTTRYEFPDPAVLHVALAGAPPREHTSRQR